MIFHSHLTILTTVCTGMQLKWPKTMVEVVQMLLQYSYTCCDSHINTTPWFDFVLDLICFWLIISLSVTYILSNAGSTELNASVPDEVKLEHFEMNTEITTTGNIAYVTTGDTIPATQNVAYGQVRPGTDDCYDYVVWFKSSAICVLWCNISHLILALCCITY